jgi:hypothetical protein
MKYGGNKSFETIDSGCDAIAEKTRLTTII